MRKSKTAMWPSWRRNSTAVTPQAPVTWTKRSLRCFVISYTWMRICLCCWIPCWVHNIMRGWGVPLVHFLSVHHYLYHKSATGKITSYALMLMSHFHTLFRWILRSSKRALWQCCLVLWTSALLRRTAVTWSQVREKRISLSEGFFFVCVWSKL